MGIKVVNRKMTHWQSESVLPQQIKELNGEGAQGEQTETTRLGKVQMALPRERHAASYTRPGLGTMNMEFPAF